MSGTLRRVRVPQPGPVAPSCFFPGFAFGSGGEGLVLKYLTRPGALLDITRSLCGPRDVTRTVLSDGCSSIFILTLALLAAPCILVRSAFTVMRTKRSCPLAIPMNVFNRFARLFLNRTMQV